jgi:hypothetical protein
MFVSMCVGFVPPLSTAWRIAPFASPAGVAFGSYQWAVICLHACALANERPAPRLRVCVSLPLTACAPSFVSTVALGFIFSHSPPTLSFCSPTTRTSLLRRADQRSTRSPLRSARRKHPRHQGETPRAVPFLSHHAQAYLLLICMLLPPRCQQGG